MSICEIVFHVTHSAYKSTPIYSRIIVNLLSQKVRLVECHFYIQTGGPICYSVFIIPNCFQN